MAEDTIKRIDEGTVEAFERVCSVLGHDVTGQFSIFNNAWQVIQLAIMDSAPSSDLSPAEQTRLHEAVAAIMPLVESVMQIGEDARTFLFPHLLADASTQSERELNQARWAPYDRAAWNAFFAGVRDHLNRAFVQLDEIEARIADLHNLRITCALSTFDHFEPMLAANLRARLTRVINTYTLDAAPET